jgi:hypothetical protein
MPDTCESHRELFDDVKDLKKSSAETCKLVKEIHIGLNGAPGAVGAFERLAKVESVVEKYKPTWTIFSKATPHFVKVIRMLVWIGLAATAGELIALKGGVSSWLN